MQILKPQSLSLIHRTLFESGRYRLCISPILFFSLSDPDKIVSEQQGWQKVMSSLGAGEVLDVGAPKYHAEVLISGFAVPPKGSSLRSMKVGFSVADKISKLVDVYGDQRWERISTNKWQLSEIQPLNTTPLSWVNAYGGPGYLDNPMGKGYFDSKVAPDVSVIDLPNIRSTHGVYDRFPITENYEPPLVSFGAIPIDSPVRQSRAGTYDDHWLENDYPGLAADHDVAVYNVAQEDQWLDEPLNGDETITISGMHSEHAVFSSRLPAMRPRAFVQRQGMNSDEVFEVALNIDTLWLFPDQDMGLIISRGTCDVGDSESQDIKSVMLAYERISDQLRCLNEYKKVHRLRTDPDSSAAHVLHDAQLTPHKTAQQLQREESELQAEKRKREQLVAESSSSISKNTEAAFSNETDTLVNQLIDDHSSVTPIDPTLLSKLAHAASKLEGQYKSENDAHSHDKKIDEAIAQQVDELPLETLAKVSSENVDLELIADQASFFAKQCQEMRSHEISLSADNVLSLSSSLKRTLTDTSAVTRDTLEEQGIQFDALNQAVKGLLSEYQRHIDSIAHCEGIAGAPEARTLDRTEGGEPNFELNDLIAAIPETAEQSLKQTKQTIESSMQAAKQKMSSTFNQMPVITPESIKRGDIDLSGVISAAKKITESCEQESNESLRTLDQRIEKATPDTMRDVSAGMLDKLRPLCDIKAELDARFEPLSATKYLDINQLQDIEHAKRLNRLAAPSDSTDAKIMAPDARQYMRSRVLTLLQRKQSLVGMDLSGGDYSGFDFSGLDLSDVLFESADLSACNFNSANLTKSVLSGAKVDKACFDECIFDYANVSAIEGDNTSFMRCAFDQAKLFNASLTNANFSNSQFKSIVVLEASLSACIFNNCDFDRSQWVKCDLRSSQWAQSNLNSCVFMQSELTSASFDQTNASRCIFVEVDLNAARFRSSNLECVQFAGSCDLEASDFSNCIGATVGLLGIDLSDATFLNSVFKESNFSECDFNNAQLDGAGFLKCVFLNAKFNATMARETNFMESLMSKSYWLDSDLSHSDFFNANVKQCVLERCHLNYVANMGAMAEVRI